MKSLILLEKYDWATHLSIKNTFYYYIKHDFMIELKTQYIICVIILSYLYYYFYYLFYLYKIDYIL
jgi:hypothetical protein